MRKIDIKNLIFEIQSQVEKQVKERTHKLRAYLLRISLKYKILYISITVAIFWLWGLFTQVAYFVQGGSHRITLNIFVCIIRIFTCSFTAFLWGLFLLLLFAGMFGLWYYRNHKDDPKVKIINRNGKFIRQVLDDGTLTTDREMTNDELEENFITTYEPEKEKSITLGKSIEDNRTVLMPKVEPDEERNSLVVGSIGSGKTTCYILPLIAKVAKMGENMVITDPSTEIFKKTYGLLKKFGYNVKVINTQHPQHSDSWNFVSEIGADDFSLAQIFATTIIDNTSSGAREEQFWSEHMKNLLAASIMFVNSLEESKRNITEIVRMITTNSLTTLTNKFRALEENHPARTAFETFAKDEAIAKKVLGNLGLRLKIFFDPARQKLLSTDDIRIVDLADPEKKTAIFIITDELDTTYSSIAAMFLDASFKNLTQEAKTKYGGILPRSVHFIYEEFCNIGKIHEMGKKLSVSRKYGIVVHMICQNIPQLIRPDRYSKEEGEEIIAACRYQMCFSTGDDTTRQFFSDMTGEMTVLTKQKTTDSPILNVTGSLRSTLQKRPVYTPGEIKTMYKRDFLLFSRDLYVVKLNKCHYSEMEEYKSLTPEEKIFDITEYMGSVNFAKKQNTRTRANRRTKKQPENITPEIPETEIIPITENKKSDESSYYYENGTPIFFVEKQENEQLVINLNIAEEDRKTMNKIPSEKQRIKKDVILKDFTGLVYKDEGNILRFKKGNNKDKQVYILRFCSYANCLEGQLPADQIRCGDELLNMEAITKNIPILNDNYYIKFWYVKNLSAKEADDIWNINESYRMPFYNTMLIPHIEPIEPIEEYDNVLNL